MSLAFDDTGSPGLATKVAAAAGGLVLLVALLAAGAGAGIASLLGGGAAAPSDTATVQIPPAMLALYQRAAATCPGLPWTVLAAIATVESDNGQSTLPGVHAGANAARAMGYLQMLGPTFAAYDEPVPPRRRHTAQPLRPGRRGVRGGAAVRERRSGRRRPLRRGVFAYNHASWYVAEVLSLAKTYGETEAQTVAAGTAGGIAVDWALAQVGTPYVWGGETPASGSTARGSSRPPTASPASTCRASPRTSTTRRPSSDPATRSNQATSSSSGEVRQRSLTSGSTSATVRWSTHPTPVPTSGWSWPRRPRATSGATRSWLG